MSSTSKFAKKREDFRRLREQLGEDYRAHGSDWTKPGFRAVAVHRLAAWVETLGRPRFLQVVLKWFCRVLHVHVRNHYAIELPLSTKVGRRLRIAHQGGIVIHGLSQIGDDCLIHQNVTMGSATDETITRAPILGNRVEVGAGAALIGAVVIGDNVRIGPNAVVTMNVPAGSTVVAPAPRVLRLQERQPPLSLRDTGDGHSHERAVG
jgi:serine O-acetyltransferase